ncbi:hypothetical protein C8R45DRAFT_966485 [Mycena sanguinolenta]|nr:hypothetical protein C8R45DRAFT_966485 [Mycena sanguinolenta]
MSIEMDPTLPPELEHRIFETAALARPTSIPALMLVAKRVRCWVEPILYHVVFLRRSAHDEAYDLGLPIFTPDAVEQRPYEYFQHVRYLFIGASVDETMLQAWLRACTGITNLFAQCDYTPEILPLLSRLTEIRYLTISGDVFSDPFSFSPNLTHLELLDSESNLDHICQSITLIPRLTHIAFNSSMESRLHPTLCANAQLRCIVFLSPLHSFDGSPLADDDRFVCVYENEVRYYVDWLHGAVFGQHYWSLADAFLAARRAGKIDRTYPNAFTMNFEC